eukprot:3339657-Amphidinium_carterae.1
MISTTFVFCNGLSNDLCSCASWALNAEVHEYLLLKGIEAVAIHGGLDQEERHEAIRGFKEGTKDVLIGTDVASKVAAASKRTESCENATLGKPPKPPKI